MEETTALFKRLVIFLWIYLLFFGVDCGQEKEVACTSKSIRNDVSKFKILENCTIIEGFLHIVLIERVMEADFAKLSFPKLVEITGHMLLYRVDGLRTLRHIFPNLAVIRGQELFHNYALAAYQMQDLEELGLVSLTAIKRGAVRLEKNSKLCYVDTIDWGKLAASDNWKDNVFLENKDEQECVNICPDSCSRSTVDGKEAKRCWNSKDCQKGLNCGCGKGIFCNDVTGECCHHYCMGGCRAPGKDNCLACKAVIYNGICEPRCNPETYKYMDRRCLLDRECMNMENHQKEEEWKIIRGESGKDGEKEGKCIKECPNGYTKNTTTPNIRECTKCSAHCPKVCYGRVIDSIDAAQTLTGCTSIIGPLEIEIDGGSNIVAELEKSLGEIETVSHYIKITRSYPIISLHFFKKLKVINGEKLDQSYYSLNIFDNPNLQELFSPEVTKNLKIKNGKTKFNFNRKLCFYKIENFLNEVGLANDTDGLDDVKNTNGDSIPCEVNTLNLSVQDVSHHSVFLKWDQFKTHDMRPLLSYVVHYREVQSKNVNIFQGRDACSESVWKTKEVEPDKNSNPEEFISSLRPWTLYAAYIQTYTIGRASSSAISNLTYFRTKPYYPSAPTNLEITAEIEGELKVTWDPPKLPNGNVTYYIVRWRRQLLKREEFDKRDYCVEPLDLNRDKKEKDKKKEEAKKNLTLPSGGQCCRCPKTPQEEEEENRIRLNEIAFENALHDEVYVKRSENDMGYRRKREVPSQNDIQTGKQRYMFGNTDDEDIDVKRLRGKVDGKNSSISNDTEETIQENKSIVRSQEIHLPNLGHSQPYTVEVVACLSDKDKHGKDMCSHSHSQGNSAIANARTLASKTADTINASTISIKVNRTEVKLKWAEPKKPNGLIIKFEINYKKVHINDEYRPAFCINYTKYHSIHGYKLEKLQPGNYSFQIRATSLAGPGEWTPIKYFFIEDFGNGSRIDQKVIIAIVIGVILVIVITIIVVWFVAKNRFAKESELANNLIVSHNPNYFPAGDVYIPDGWEVDRDKIELIREIGEGSFGMVYEGIASDLPPYKGPMNIAVKTVNDQANVQDKMNFLKEACIMKAFSCYHVVKLLGVVSQGQPAYVIMELMKNGDLKNYLRSHRPDVEDNNGAPPPTLKEILQMAGEIADGMAYLADKKFVHRDLAARNCMVADDNTVKIGDFGMTRDIYMTDYYRKGGKGLLPVRWMAPESLKDGIFTTMSDVWSYGVVLWEMATLAAQPYQGLSNEEVLRYVSEGKFMEKPEGCPDRLYDLMLKCWQYKDKNRPTFKEIIEMLVPDLHPSFKDVSYFFSDENKPPDGPEFNDVMEEDLADVDIDTYKGDIEHPNYFNLQDESTIPFIEDCDKDEGNTSPSRKIRPSTSGPCECVMLEELGDVKTHRASNCSSQNSALGNSDGSKESSKSSDGSYTQRNGLANGHIHLRLPRTTTC